MNCVWGTKRGARMSAGIIPGELETFLQTPPPPPSYSPSGLNHTPLIARNLLLGQIYDLSLGLVQRMSRTSFSFIFAICICTNVFRQLLMSLTPTAVFKHLGVVATSLQVLQHSQKLCGTSWLSVIVPSAVLGSSVLCWKMERIWTHC